MSLGVRPAGTPQQHVVSRVITCAQTCAQVPLDGGRAVHRDLVELQFTSPLHSHGRVSQGSCTGAVDRNSGADLGGRGFSTVSTDATTTNGIELVRRSVNFTEPLYLGRNEPGLPSLPIGRGAWQDALPPTRALHRRTPASVPDRRHQEDPARSPERSP